MTVSFKTSDAEHDLLDQIAERALAMSRGQNPRATVTKMDLLMDVTATHANGCPLNLAALLAADEFNFLHDIGGIGRHLDRDTGKLTNCFRPRFAAKDAGE